MTHEQVADAIRAAFGCGVSEEPIEPTGAQLSVFLTGRRWGARFHGALAHAYRAGLDYRKGTLLTPGEHWRTKQDREREERGR